MKTPVITLNAPKPMGPYSQAIIAGNLIFVSALLGEDPATGELILDNIEAETTRVMDNIKAILAGAGIDFTHVVKASIFLKDMQNYSKVNDIYSSYLSAPFPARETIQVAGLPKDVNIEISVIAVKN
jgi:2-iminobutanoate/2-iminopropanoate deaminase